MKQEDTSRKFSGEWLLLFNNEIVDHSANVEDILKAAEEVVEIPRIGKKGSLNVATTAGIVISRLKPKS